VSTYDTEDRPDPTHALETALWCNRCMLPSGVRWPWPDADDGSFFDLCEDCDGYLDENSNVMTEYDEA
jgi:hypothetical protein